MRIIAGVAKGRTLSGVADSTRPTSDRAREALFSTLVSEFGTFDDLKVLDLFAGTGAIALEALSRGAAVVHTVEKDARASEVITRNFQVVQQSHPAGSFHLFSMSVNSFLKDNVTLDKYHIVYIDPPYEMANSDVEKVLDLLISHLDPIALIAVERDSKSHPFAWPTGYQESRIKNYGTATIYYAGVAS